MDRYKHTDLLILQSEELTGRTPFCPEDQEIAAYYDGGLNAGRRNALERHLADCRFCRARIGMMERVRTEGDDAPVSEDDLAAAKLLAARAPARRRKPLGRWAAAAVLVLAVTVVLHDRIVNRETAATSPAAGTEEAVRQLRSIERSAGRLSVFFDAPTDAVTAGSFVRWAGISDPIHYNVYVLSAQGNVLWTERTVVPEWTFAGDLPLAAGTGYFLRIEAVLSDGGTLSSRHILFQTAGWR